MRKVILALVVALSLGACVSRPEPEPAVMRDSMPPWSAPRDAISYIDAAGLEQRPIGEDTDPWLIDLTVQVDGEPVAVPAMIGIDRLRAVQAIVHTHDDAGVVWLEGPDNDRATLGHFFRLWGVDFDGECLAASCNGVEVLADGAPVADPVNLQLRGHKTVEVRAH